MKRLATIIVTLFAFQALAEDAPQAPAAPTVGREAVIDQRQENQENRIQQGVESGSLNANEAKRMEKRQDQIQKMENKAMADGKVSKKEFRRIEHRQNQASKKIYRTKHNRR